MNSKQYNKSQDQNTEQLKEIPKWTRKYAQNRTLTILVLTVMITLFGMFVAVLVGFPLALAVAGFWKGKMVLGCVGTAVLVAGLVAIVKFYIFIFAKFGGKNKGLIDQIIDRWIYGQEGFASMPAPKSTKKKNWLDGVVGLVAGVCILGTMYLGMEGYLAFKYMQPVSALYFIPFLVYIYFQQRPRIGPLVLICPILYTIHAILIIAGVPIFFTGNFCMLNLAVPAFGYTFLAYVIGHVYSRYALKKLKGLAHLEGDTANGD